MSITQQRIYELTSLNWSGLDLSTTYVAVDSLVEGWDKPRKVPMLDILAIANRIEAATITPESTSVVITFGTAFAGVPSGYYRVYKDVDVGGGKIIQQQVNHYNWAVTASGMTLTIDEDITGVKITYLFTE